LKALGLGSKNCRQIAKIVGLNWNTTHRHLEILLKEDLVRNMQFGQRYFFKLTQKGEDAVKNFKESS
jgi:predicted transcriptional regulator